MIAVTAEDADRTIAVKVGDEIAIALAENSTTGFQWTVESLPPELTMIASDLEGGDAARPGAAGRRTIRLHAASPGTAQLRLRYGRRWEGEGGGRQCAFTFAIKSA